MANASATKRNVIAGATGSPGSQARSDEESGKMTKKALKEDAAELDDLMQGRKQGRRGKNDQVCQSTSWLEMYRLFGRKTPGDL